MASEKAHQGGVRFECTQCGNCCTGEPGYVWVTRQDIRRIAAFLGRDDAWLSPDQVRRIGFKYSLTELANGDCVFLTTTKQGQRVCGIYSVRPLQCRTWPFWTENLRSPERWAEAGEMCPGINDGKTHNFVAIEEVRLKKSWDNGELDQPMAGKG